MRAFRRARSITAELMCMFELGLNAQIEFVYIKSHSVEILTYDDRTMVIRFSYTSQYFYSGS